MARRLIQLILPIVVVIIAIARPAPVKAIEQSPLLLMKNGDLWTWNGSKLQQRTHYGANYVPVLSPDGKQIAYLSIAEGTFADDQGVTGEHGGQKGVNVWLLNIATNDALRIADQPPDAVLPWDLGYQKLMLRSLPSWSPDGAYVAWVEALYETKPSSDNQYGTLVSTPTGQLIIYDVAAKKSRVLVDNLPILSDGSDYGLPDALWGPSGIALMAEVSTGGGDTLTVYSVDGKLLSQSTTVKGNVIQAAHWLAQSSQDDIAVQTNDLGPLAQWQVADPMKDESLAPMTGTLAVFSANNPQRATVKLEKDGSWYANEGDTSKAISTDQNLIGVAISPDGTQIAYVTQASFDDPIDAYIYAGGQSTLIATDVDVWSLNDDSLRVSPIMWGPLSWTLSP